MTREYKYILDDGEAVPCTDLFTWGKWLETADHKIANTEVKDVRVSTVFLGFDHSFGNGPPMLFETMIFRITDDGAMDYLEPLDYQERYATRAEAIAGHTRAVDWVLVAAVQVVDQIATGELPDDFKRQR